MGRRIPRNEIIKNLKDKIAQGEPIIGCGAGTGISAKFEESGGADLMIIYNSGRYRMQTALTASCARPCGNAPSYK